MQLKLSKRPQIQIRIAVLYMLKFDWKKSIKSHSYRWLASGNTGFLSLTVLLHRSWFFNYVGWNHFLWRFRRWSWRFRPGQSGQPFPSDLKIEIPIQCFDRKKLCEVNYAGGSDPANWANLFRRIWKSKFQCYDLTEKNHAKLNFAAIFWQKIPFVFVRL